MSRRNVRGRGGPQRGPQDLNLMQRAIAAERADAQKRFGELEKAFGQKIAAMAQERANLQALLALLVEDRGGFCSVSMARLKETGELAEEGKAYVLTQRVFEDRVDLWYPEAPPELEPPAEQQEAASA